jgi:hypothetical protein
MAQLQVMVTLRTARRRERCLAPLSFTAEQAFKTTAAACTTALTPISDFSRAGCRRTGRWSSRKTCGHACRKTVDSIIYATARRPNEHPILNFAANFAKRQLKSLDVRDCHGFTPLEIAIRMNNARAVSLLLQSGASATRANCDGQSPLQLATHAFSGQYNEVIGLILRHGGCVNDPEGSSEVKAARRPLDMAIACLSLPANRSKTQAIYTLICHILQRMQPDSQRDAMSFRSFLVIQTQHQKMLDQARGFRSEVLACYKLFLRYGQNTLEVEWPHADCSPLELDKCKSLASYALFHAPDPALGELILKCCPMQHTKDLIRLVLAPCPGRLPSRSIDYLSNLLRTLLARPNVFAADENPLALVMGTSRAPEVAPFLEATLASGYTNVHMPDSRLGRPILALTDLPEPYSWKAAELLLRHCGGLTHSSARMPADTLLIDLHRSTLALYATGGYLDHIYHYIEGICERDGFPIDDAAELQRDACGCHKRSLTAESQTRALQKMVIHVVTRDALENRLDRNPLPYPLERLRDALSLRKRFDLPELALNNRLLLGVVEAGLAVVS